MAYVELQKLNEENLAALTAAELAQRGVTEMPGYGGVMIRVNPHGYMVNPADHLPNGLLGKLQANWAGAHGNVSDFYNSQIDGQSVKSILGQMPSQQAYSIGAKLNGFPPGTDIPAQTWGKNWTAIKWGGRGNPPSPPTPGPVPPGPVPPGPTPPGPSPIDPFFIDPKFLIGVATIAGIIALLKTLGNTIKVRFRKCARVLYNMQRDFGSKPEGMDMKAVLPGVGSRIMDFIAKIWTPKHGKGKNKGALGLVPFVENYRNEIAADYDQALRSYNMIASYKYEQTKDNTTSGAMNNFEKPKTKLFSRGKKLQSENPGNTEESLNTEYNPNTVVYESFADALRTTSLYESFDNSKDEHLDEAALGLAISGGFLALNAIRMFKGQYQAKIKNKQGQYEERNIAVTKKSTREVCYAILNLYYDKYFNLEKVFQKLGIKDFADINTSNVDKFQQIANKMAETAEGSTDSTNVKMYGRVKNNYNKMVDAYLRIARGVVENFKKYTKKKKQEKGKDLGEKDDNLLNAAYEKLNAELERQEDGYKNNFGRVLNSIVSSPEYLKFTDLVIKKVIPVFKTGLAGEADYALDLLPRVGDYFVVRQTGEQEGLLRGDTAKGNVALVRVLDVKKEGEEGDQKVSITFARTALLQSVDPDNLDSITRDGRLVYDLKNLRPENIDRTAFSNVKGKEADRSSGGDSITFNYGKWIALDPREVINVPGEDKDPEDMKRTKLYRRELKVNGKDIVEYVYGEVPVSEGVDVTSTHEFEEDMNISEAQPTISSENGNNGNGGGTTGGNAGNNAGNTGGNAGGNANTDEGDPESKDANIKNIVCVNISKDQEENLLNGNIQQLQFTGSYIELETPCSGLQLGEILTDAKNFNPNPYFEALSGKVKEKDAIRKLISQQTGYTHVSHQKVAKVEDIIQSINNIETRQTTTEKLSDKVPEIAEDIKKINAAINAAKETAVFTPDNNVEAKGIKIPYMPNGATKDGTGLAQQLQNVQLKMGKIVLHSGTIDYISNAGDKNGNPVTITIDIDLYIKNGNKMLNGKDCLDNWIPKDPSTGKPDTSKRYTVKDFVAKDPQFFNKNGFAFRLGWVNHNDNKGTTLAQDPRFSKWEDITSGKEAEALGEVIQKFSEYLKYEPGRGNDIGKKDNVSTSFAVEYSDMFNLAESFMGTLSYLKVNRKVTPSVKTKEQYYVLSENAWGDGVIRDPEGYLKNFVNNSVMACKTYDDFAKLAKSSVSINFMPLSEDCSYKTRLPYNRYGMLTQSNPLYEATVVVSFRNDETVKTINNLGISKIAK